MISALLQGMQLSSSEIAGPMTTGERVMSEPFMLKNIVPREELPWGSLAWYCRPKEADLKHLVVIEVTIKPGQGHAFHRHPYQDEVIYCLKGTVEQWVGDKMHVLGPGDAVNIPAGGVHASFNRGEEDAVLLAIIGPAAENDNGYFVEELADQEPWRTLLEKRAQMA